MADPKIVGEWLDKADEDFNFARVNLEVKVATRDDVTAMPGDKYDD